MHLKLRVPNIWFRTRVMYPDARGPGLMMTSLVSAFLVRPRLPWAPTARLTGAHKAYLRDSIDWVRVLLHPEPLRYRSPTGWKTVTVYNEVLHVHGAAG